LQAIAMALGVIEGEEVQEKLLDLYYEKVNRTREIRSVFNPKL
jgi:truncated hemoglobin YjbI